jgi:hypothetical protein
VDLRDAAAVAAEGSKAAVAAAAFEAVAVELRSVSVRHDAVRLMSVILDRVDVERPQAGGKNDARQVLDCMLFNLPLVESMLFSPRRPSPGIGMGWRAAENTLGNANGQGNANGMDVAEEESIPQGVIDDSEWLAPRFISGNGRVDVHAMLGKPPPALEVQQREDLEELEEQQQPEVPDEAPSPPPLPCPLLSCTLASIPAHGWYSPSCTQP